jgi:hypothetical protein
MTLFVRHCEGQRPEAISQLRLLRRRNDDLAVTPSLCHCERSEAVSYSHEAKGKEDCFGNEYTTSQ